MIKIDREILQTLDAGYKFLMKSTTNRSTQYIAETRTDNYIDVKYNDGSMASRKWWERSNIPTWEFFLCENDIEKSRYSGLRND